MSQRSNHGRHLRGGVASWRTGPSVGFGPAAAAAPGRRTYARARLETRVGERLTAEPQVAGVPKLRRGLGR
jgi:hypothetical protein